MFYTKTLSFKDLENMNFNETKMKVKKYFKKLDNIKWEWAKLNAQKGMIANYDFSAEYKKLPCMQIGKDEFNLSAKEYKEEQLIKYISCYYWANSFLSDIEQLYIKEYFENGRNEKEIIALLGFNNIYEHEFRKLKRSAVYKFADFLNLVVEKNKEYKYWRE